MDFKRVVKDGILDKEVIPRQTQSAIQYITEANPTKILTLSRECSVSVVPFSYLAGKYGEDLALLWLDAHPETLDFPLIHIKATTQWLLRIY